MRELEADHSSTIPDKTIKPVVVFQQFSKRYNIYTCNMILGILIVLCYQVTREMFTTISDPCMNPIDGGITSGTN